MTIARVSFTVAALLLIGFESAAEPSPPLTADSIQRFLASLNDVEKLVEQFTKSDEESAAAMEHARKEMSSMGGAGAMQPPTNEQLERALSPFSSSLPVMSQSAGYDEMIATVKLYGFSSVEQWASVGDNAVRAYAATRMDAELPKIQAQMDEMRANLKKSGMPPERQEAMLKMMDSGSALTKTFDDVSAADKKAIAPFQSQFEELEIRQRDEG
jgi:hypothetical protein